MVSHADWRGVIKRMAGVDYRSHAVGPNAPGCKKSKVGTAQCVVPLVSAEGRQLSLKIGLNAEDGSVHDLAFGDCED